MFTKIFIQFHQIQKLFLKFLKFTYSLKFFNLQKALNVKLFLPKQNWYPDMTFIHKDNENVKFAVDIKTTFRRNHKTAGFTLGSQSFWRQH